MVAAVVVVGGSAARLRDYEERGKRSKCKQKCRGGRRDTAWPLGFKGCAGFHGAFLTVTSRKCFSEFDKGEAVHEASADL